MSKKNPIPDGYWQSADGSLHHVDSIKPIDQQRDALVREIIGEAQLMSGQLGQFKVDVMRRVDAFVDESAKKYQIKKLGGVKGNVTLQTFDGRLKIVRAMQDKLSFSEQLQAAKALIDECLRDWTSGDGVPKELRAIVSRAFRQDKAGNISVGKVLDLRSVNIDDKRWKRAMQAISDAITVTGTKPYFRAYERDDESGAYKPIPLDVAGA